MDNEIDRKIDVTAILFLLVQNRQQTHGWTLIEPEANGLGIQEWDPPPALLHRFWPPAFLGSTQKKTEKKDGEEKIKDDIISQTLWPRRASLALSLRILSLRKTKLICCLLNISLLFLIKQANNIYELPACLFAFDTRRSIWLN